MSASSRQPQWDIYEAVVLLDGYLESLRGRQPRSHIIKRVSADLRQMAIHRGIEIDDIYRNENGIHFQMLSMESAFREKTIHKTATKRFTDTVKLFWSDKKEYLRLLKKADRMIKGAKPSL